MSAQSAGTKMKFISPSTGAPEVTLAETQPEL